MAVVRKNPNPNEPSDLGLGPRGPFPNTALRLDIERRWLHYAFLSRDLRLGLVANIAWLGPAAQDDVKPKTSILLLHNREEGWIASQFNAGTLTPLWSAFRQPHAIGREEVFELGSTAGAPWVQLQLQRSSHPCTSQCVPFAQDQHFRWQSETGVLAHGNWGMRKRTLRRLSAVGYHERVRGNWGWPELGGWVFGFANDVRGEAESPPPYAAVFTFLNPTVPTSAANASFMLWKDGRLRRHFPRRSVSMAVRGLLERNHVRQVPALADLFGVPPMPPIPRRLVITAHLGSDHACLDFESEAAARIIIPSETSLRPFSVHEVIGNCRLEGKLNGAAFALETRGIVEFAGGAAEGMRDADGY